MTVWRQSTPGCPAEVWNRKMRGGSKKRTSSQWFHASESSKTRELFNGWLQKALAPACWRALAALLRGVSVECGSKKVPKPEGTEMSCDYGRFLKFGCVV